MKKLLGDVDYTIFGGAAAIYLALFIFIVAVPQTAEQAITATLNFTLNKIGWIYLLSFSLILIFLAFLAMSRFGDIKLGAPDDQPEYSFFGWASMLFIAGLGVGLVFFGVHEPMSHYYNSPFAADHTAEAATVAMRTTFFHWGFHPWAMYTATGLAIAYFEHRKGLPGRVSSCFEPMLGREGINGNIGKIIDIFSIVAILCGMATSIGFAGNQFAAGMVSQYGFEKSDNLVVVAIITICGLGTFSALKGVAKGIKILSDFNLWLVLGLIAFMAVAGPTMYQFNIFFETLGDYFNAFPKLSFFLDANGAVAEKMGYNWVGGWSVMYFAWWVSFAPFVGGFLSNISRGRTIREFVVACVTVPSILCFIWFTCFGGSAIGLDMHKLITTGAEMAKNSPEALFILLRELPLSSITIFLAMALVIILITTSVNSATYVMGVMSVGAKTIEPSLGLRGFWGSFMAINALLLLWVGGLKVLRNSSMVGALPFMIILLLMLVNMFLALRKEMSGEYA